MFSNLVILYYLNRESEDTMLLILTEIYGSMGILKDHPLAGTSGVVSPSQQSGPQSLTAQIQHLPLNYGGNSSNTSAQQILPTAPPLSEYSAVGQTSSHPAVMPNSSGLSVSNTQNVPMMSASSPGTSVLFQPNLAFGGGSPNKSSAGSRSTPAVIGNRPVVDPSHFPQGKLTLAC